MTTVTSSARNLSEWLCKAAMLMLVALVAVTSVADAAECAVEPIMTVGDFANMVAFHDTGDTLPDRDQDGTCAHGHCSQLAFAPVKNAVSVSDAVISSGAIFASSDARLTDAHLSRLKRPPRT